MTWIARLILESSPPEAIFAREPGLEPGIVDILNSISSMPVCDQLGDSPSDTSNFAPSIPRPCKPFVTSGCNRFALSQPGFGEFFCEDLVFGFCDGYLLLEFFDNCFGIEYLVKVRPEYGWSG